jgi:isopenicillin-N epimerase
MARTKAKDSGGPQPLDRAAAAALWDFHGVDYLNHGSFGACPRPVRDFQERERAEMLSNPIDYFNTVYPRRTLEARKFWADFARADEDGVVLVGCLAEGVNSVLAALALRGWFRPGGEILLTSHGYNGTNNAALEIATVTGASITAAPVPFPLEDPSQVTQAVLGAVTKKTRLALIDHITSKTGLVFPIAEIVKGLKERGVETLVDGAHAPAQVALDVAALGAAFYTGNGHKWLCAAPGSAFLYVREDFRDRIRPLSISNGINDPSSGLSTFQKAFSWTGTLDPTARWTAPVAQKTLSSLHPGGLAAVIADNCRLARYGTRLLLDALGAAPPAPDSMIGTMASVILPPGDPARLQNDLRRRDGVQLAIMPFSASGVDLRLLRVCAQAYNSEKQYEKLARALLRALADEKRGALLPLPS